MVKQITQIQHATYQPGDGTDNDGYPNADSYNDAVPRDTFGWYPLTSVMSPDSTYDRRIIDHLVILVPDPTVYTVRDQITLPGDETPWFVSEDIRDYSHNPFTYNPGGEIVIEKITG